MEELEAIQSGLEKFSTKMKKATEARFNEQAKLRENMKEMTKKV